jgi:hypothetical protein
LISLKLFSRLWSESGVYGCVLVNLKPVDIKADGKVTTTPFFWTAAGMPPGGGIPYSLEKDGKTIKDGRLRANFRVVSIFWPPFALIYWPMGFNPEITYDLVNDTQE